MSMFYKYLILIISLLSLLACQPESHTKIINNKNAGKLDIKDVRYKLELIPDAKWAIENLEYNLNRKYYTFKKQNFYVLKLNNNIFLTQSTKKKRIGYSYGFIKVINDKHFLHLYLGEDLGQKQLTWFRPLAKKYNIQAKKVDYKSLINSKEKLLLLTGDKRQLLALFKKASKRLSYCIDCWQSWTSLYD